MIGNFSKGLVTGSLIGAAAGLMMVPRLGMRNKKRVNRISKMVFRNF